MNGHSRTQQAEMTAYCEASQLKRQVNMGGAARANREQHQEGHRDPLMSSWCPGLQL